ncbi:BrnA antitoxin family protein [Methylobacterium sp. EM32]|uniref:BrnA antitoxin family protein n=1 Tax=Methylobacterium sp. EM32 TaxID=3163481 RepID=UPI0033A1168C
MPKRDIRPIADEEEARIQAGIAQDPDNPEWTEADFKSNKPFAEVFPELAASVRRRGPVRTKEAISIRIDKDVLEKLRASGDGWRSRINDVLREYVERNAA